MLIARITKISPFRASSRNESRRNLEQRIEEKLSQDKELADRIGALETRFEQTGAELESTEPSMALETGPGPSKPPDQLYRNSTDRPSSWTLRPMREFEKLLHESRPYRRTHRKEDNDCDVSLYTGTVRAGRVLALSYAETANISTFPFVALPVELSELGSRGYYE